MHQALTPDFPLPMAPLRVAPVGDPRPNIHDDKVLRRAVDANAHAILQWARKRDYPETDDEVLEVVTEALAAEDGIADRAFEILETVYFWEVDDNLLIHIECCAKNIAVAHRLSVLEWVIRTGVRVPAHVGDVIDFFDGSYHYVGRVTEIKNEFAACLIDHDGSPQIVLAEQITGNRTTGHKVPRIIKIESVP